MKKPTWFDWPQQPPVSMLPDLERDLEPFSVAMVWVHHRVREIMAMAFPFATRTLLEGRAARGIARDPGYETECLMQPVVHAVFAEWVLTRPPRDANTTLQEFAQFCCDCVSRTTMQSTSQESANDDPGRRPH